MKETLLLGVVAFLVATGGGTWFGAYFAPPRSSRPAMTSGPDAGITGGGKPDTRKPAASAKPAAAPSKPLAKGEPSKPSAKTDTGTPAQPDSARAVEAVGATPTLPAASPAKDPKAAKEVGKILVSMKPAQAAKILEKLTDDDIEAIIRQLNPKQVAPLFVALPSERAVSMSRRLLLHATKKEGRSS